MKKRWLRVFLGISFLESGIFFYLQLLNLRELAELKPIFSSFNIITLVFLGLIMLGILTIAILDLRGPSVRYKLARIAEEEHLFWGVLGLFSLIFIESGQNLLFLRAELPDIIYPFFLSENSIIFQWALIISLQALIFMVGIWFKSRKSKDNIKIDLNWKIGIGLVFLILLILVVSGTGFISRSVNIVDHGGTFDTTNAPLPMIQVGFIWLALTAAWLLQKRFLPHWKVTKSEIVKSLLIITIIWAAAFLIWSNVPVTPNYFVDEIRAPNDQHNPISDSIFYETQAQRLLNGEGFYENVQHPLYGYFLSGLHLVGGDHYEDIYLLQIAILAIIPVLVFKLTSLMLSPFAGWLTSFLFIAREYNALILGDSITITNVQLIMTEMIAQLGVILVVYLMLTWIKQPERSRKGLPVLIGSVIGLLALLRVELLSLALVFVLVGLILEWGNWKKWILNSLVMVSTVLLLTVPWMARNWQVTGYFYLDKRNFLLREIQVYTNLFSETDQSPSLELDQEVADPDQISLSKVQKIFYHSKSSLSESVLYLPSNHHPLGGIDNYLVLNLANRKIRFEKGVMFSDSYLTAYIKTLPYWSMNWDGSIVLRTLLPMCFVMLLMFQGFLLVWERNRLVALTPIFVLFSHILVYSLFSRSGGRFIQVVDWITLVYFSLGLTWLSHTLGLALGWNADDSQIMGERPDPAGSPIDNKSLSGINPGVMVGAVVAILIGFSMPIAEAVIPEKYTAQEFTIRLETINPQILDQDSFQIMEEGNPGWVMGKAIYPGYFRAGKELLDDRNGRVPDGSISRLDFYLIGMENIWVSIPLDAAPEYFPHGSEVIIQGVITRDSAAYLEEGLHPYLLADRVLILQEGSENYDMIEASGLSEENLD